MRDDDSDYLLCQACGKRIRLLTAGEKRDIAWNPYNYVAFCRLHVDEAIEPQFRLRDHQ